MCLLPSRRIGGATLERSPASNSLRSPDVASASARVSRRDVVTAAMAPQLLTAEQLARRWQVPPSHVYRLTREGRIPVVRLGRYYRYRLDAIEGFELGGFDTADRAARGPTGPSDPTRVGQTRGRPQPVPTLTVRA